MTAIIGNAFRAAMNDAGLNEAVQDEDLVAHLYTNAFDPLVTSVPGDFTEADYTGYAAIVLNGGWTTTPGNPATSEHPVIQFESTDETPQSIEGYYVTKETAGTLAWARRFDEPIEISDSTAPISIRPRIRSYNGAPA